MKKLIIKNSVIVTPNEMLENQSVLVEDGRIVDLDYRGSDCDSEVVDAKGAYLLPGFVDLHVHGGGGHDFMDATSEAFEEAVKAHLNHGTTMMFPTAVAGTFEEMSDFLRAYNAFRKESSYASIAPGVHFEGPYFYSGEKLSRGAQKTSVLRSPDKEEIEAFLSIADGAILRWDAAPELEGIGEFGKRMQSLGIIAAVAHTDATAEQVAESFKNGFSHVTHFYNATSLHRKRGQKVYAGVVEATYLDDNVTIELIGDGCHIPKEDVKLAMKIKGRENISVITDGMRLSASDLTFGKLGSLKTGTDVKVDDGVAKLLDFSSFAGSIATMDRCLRVLCKDYGIAITDASVMLSLSPAKKMGFGETKGSVEVGKDADFVLVDSDFNVVKVMLSGKTVVNK